MNDTLHAAAIDILKINDRGSYTVPTKGLYPFQWNWDSCLTALGQRHFDADRALTEIETLFAHQWPCGMVPHIIFHELDDGYFPGPDVWDCRRPVPTGRVPRPEAYTFAGVMSLASVLLMGMATNYVAAGLLAFSIAFYCVIYTMWLKRLTPQNIVIGGAAGAFPPVIGWAAATGSVSVDAVILFAIIFLWTPPHSWALALYKSGDYAAAGVPMMPVARGAKSTRIQILVYTGLYLAATAGPLVTGLGGWMYAIAAGLGGALFALLALRAHLALLFAALLAEHGAGVHWPLPGGAG